MQLPIGLFGVAIATATLPAISRSAGSKNIEEFRDTLARSLGLVFLLTIPASAGLFVLGRSIVGAIYEGVKFQPYDTEQTALALACYSVGLAGYAAIKVLSPAFYALSDSRTPMWTSLGSIAVNVAVALVLVRFAGWGHAGLALSTSAVSLCSFFILFAAMRRRIGGVYGRRLGASLVKVCASTLVMTSVVWFSHRALYALFGDRGFGQFADLLVSIPLGLAVLWYACRGLRVEELDLATRALAGPIVRRLPSRARP
jgi:putative peptidoglycan lipid II flippase